MSNNPHPSPQWQPPTSQTPAYSSDSSYFAEEMPRASATGKSPSDYDPSSSSGIDTGSSQSQRTYEDKTPPKSPRWFSHVKEWLAVSEPSAQAMKDQKRTIYKRHGVDPNSPQAAAQAAARMHVPLGQVPEGAVTSTRGPSPEKALKQRIERQKKLREAGGMQSVSSSTSSVPSLRESNPAAPWE